MVISDSVKGLQAGSKYKEELVQQESHDQREDWETGLPALRFWISDRRLEGWL